MKNHDIPDQAPDSSKATWRRDFLDALGHRYEREPAPIRIPEDASKVKKFGLEVIAALGRIPVIETPSAKPKVIDSEHTPSTEEL